MTSIPSANFTPRMTFGNWFWPSRRRQLFSAASASLKIMASAVLFERHPLERTVRWRTVANELSMTFVVRKCFQRTAVQHQARHTTDMYPLLLSILQQSGQYPASARFCVSGFHRVVDAAGTLPTIAGCYP